MTCSLGSFDAFERSVFPHAGKSWMREILEESQVSIKRLAVGFKTGERGCCAEHLRALNGEALEQDTKQIAPPDPCELDSIALDTETDVVVEPPRPGGTCAAKREGEATGTDPVDVVHAVGRRPGWADTARSGSRINSTTRSSRLPPISPWDNGSTVNVCKRPVSAWAHNGIAS